MDSRPRNLALRKTLALTVGAMWLVSACLPNPRVNVSVDQFQAGFPTIVDLGLASYQYRVYNPGEPICDAIRYRRGAFTALVEEPCGLVAGDAGGDQIPFDDTARSDVARLRKALSLDAASITQIQIQIKMDSNDVASGSSFEADGCVQYFFSPGWTTLPENVPGKLVSTAVNRDWYSTDICP
jgi:hypothetical protein